MSCQVKSKVIVLMCGVRGASAAFLKQLGTSIMHANGAVSIDAIILTFINQISSMF